MAINNRLFRSKLKFDPEILEQARPATLEEMRDEIELQAAAIANEVTGNGTHRSWDWHDGAKAAKKQFLNIGNLEKADPGTPERAAFERQMKELAAADPSLLTVSADDVVSPIGNLAGLDLVQPACAKLGRDVDWSVYAQTETIEAGASASYLSAEGRKLIAEAQLTWSELARDPKASSAIVYAYGVGPLQPADMLWAVHKARTESLISHEISARVSEINEGVRREEERQRVEREQIQLAKLGEQAAVAWEDFTPAPAPGGPTLSD